MDTKCLRGLGRPDYHTSQDIRVLRAMLDSGRCPHRLLGYTAGCSRIYVPTCMHACI